MNIHLKVSGKGRPLVLFHGWGFDHRIWLSLTKAINSRYQTYLVDLPGFGQSPLMSWEHFKEELLAALPSQFALIGWSLGGLFATRLALEEQQRVSHLINIASSPYFIAKGNWPGIKKEVFTGFYNNLNKDPERVLSDFLELQLKRSSYDFTPIKTPDNEALKEGLIILENWDFRFDLKSFLKPTSYLFGRLDSIVPKQTFNTMEMEYPRFHLSVFEKSAHIPFLSEEKRFIDFLEKALL